MGTHPQHPSRRVPDGRRLVQDLPQPGVRSEFLALHDPERRELTGQLRIQRLGRLQLHERVQHLEVPEVDGRNRVEREPGPFHETRAAGVAGRPSRPRPVR